MITADKPKRGRLPPEYKQTLALNPSRELVGRTLQELGLNTVCRSAKCPNCNRCFSEGTATFMILGGSCTRGCAFCAVAKGTPEPVDPGEPGRVGEAVRRLGIGYAVITSVTRDDLPDGGAGHFAGSAEAVRAASPGTLVELLIPDLLGDRPALEMVFRSAPEVLNHNLETVPRLYPAIRPRADYRRSLEVLSLAKGAGLTVKSGFMVGLGETPDEVRRLLEDLKETGCDLVTAGQYLAPSPGHAPVERFYRPEEFREIEDYGRGKMGMKVSAGPLVRSSLGARHMFQSFNR